MNFSNEDATSSTCFYKIKKPYFYSSSHSLYLYGFFIYSRLLCGGLCAFENTPKSGTHLSVLALYHITFFSRCHFSQVANSYPTLPGRRLQGWLFRFPIVSAADSALRLRPRASPHQVPHTCTSTILTTATSQHPTNPTQPTSILRSPLAAQQNEESFPSEPPQQHLPPADSTPAKHRRIPTGLQSAAKLRKSRHVPDSPGIIPPPRPLFLLL